jgi:hypothetical protein
MPILQFPILEDFKMSNPFEKIEVEEFYTCANCAGRQCAEQCFVERNDGEFDRWFEQQFLKEDDGDARLDAWLAKLHAEETETGRAHPCPKCGSKNIHCLGEDGTGRRCGYCEFIQD